MAGKQTVQGEVEVNCPPHKVLEMFRGKQEHLPNILSDKVKSIEAHHGDWNNIGTTRRWDYVYREEQRWVIEKIESVDEENNTIVFTITDGVIMKLYYKTLSAKIEAIPKGEGCLVKWTIDFEKLYEDAPEPELELEFLISLVKDLGEHPRLRDVLL